MTRLLLTAKAWESSAIALASVHICGIYMWQLHAQELRCVLYDYDALDKDDKIGEAKIAIKDLENQQEKDIWLDVNEMQDKQPSNHKVHCHSRPR